MNILVKRHIQVIVSQSPSRAISTLENAASDLIGQGMKTLNAKLAGIDEEKLVPRVVEIWGFFWDQVLTYLEGVSIYYHSTSFASCIINLPSGAFTSSNRSITIIPLSYPQIPQNDLSYEAEWTKAVSVVYVQHNIQPSY